jgi:hypothetical protein
MDGAGKAAPGVAKQHKRAGFVGIDGHASLVSTGVMRVKWAF